MTTITPKAGFDWSLVIWGGPDELVAQECSYCGNPFDPERPVALLTLFNQDGHCASFCDDCQREWFGVQSFDDENEVQ